ncbi:MAG: DNA recombination protein RmuC [Bacteroidetes bacterium]|nr:DNA recombination protein RmuC [Bacteroidota bacterium]
MEIVFLFVGLLLGAFVTYFFIKNRPSTVEKEFQLKINDLEKEKSVFSDRIQQMLLQQRNLEEVLSKEREQIISLSSNLATKQEMVNNYLDKLENQKADIENLQKKFTMEFENLSSKILEEKSLKFVEQNRSNLDVILTPLREKIKDFEQKVEQSYKIESAERHTLKGEIKNLIELNKQISDEANNLARALKGDSKKQGNWGEVILERILERSGLAKGSEYEVQFNTTNEEGRRIQPDVIINLPDNKHIVIDSKVSLVAYDAMVNADNDDDREKYLKDHILSVRSHIKGLSEKNYQTSNGIDTPDFVLLFMPIESSFGLAVQADNELFTFAWDRKIVIVSPSTLLATMKTISSIWKQERQTRNAIEIARQGGALYDKFKNFVDDLIDVGLKMDAAKKSYGEAMNKLSSGNGNLVKRVEDLKKLGAKSTKDLPAAILEKAEESISEE